MKALVAMSLLLLIAGTAAPAEARLRFEPCGKGFECATLRAPLDYDEPRGERLSLAVTRLPARSRRRSLGSLLVNYGGPGVGAVAATKRFGADLFGAYAGRFDLVAMDPRGTGRSSPRLDCAVDQEREGIYRRPFARPAPVAPREQERIARRYAGRCERRNALLAPHVSTANVARDMDLLRRRLGEAKVTYFGFSYGTLLGATYAAMFGSHLRAAVLDGALDPRAYLGDPVDNLRAQSAGFERALDRYFAACEAVRSRCRWTRGADPQTAYDRLVRRADRRAIPARSRRITDNHTKPVSGEEINFAVAGELYSKTLWGELTEALDGARRGDASILRFLADLGYGRRGRGEYDPGLDRYFMIGASEQGYGTDPAQVIALEASNTRDHPHFFFNSGFAQVPYTVYGARDEDAYTGPFRLGERAPPVLVVGTTFDPATPYSDARNLTALLGRARLLTLEGDGHTAYGGNSPCLDRAVDRYVIARRLPRPGTRCRQRVGFDRRAAVSAAGDFVARAAPSARLTAPFAR